MIYILYILYVYRERQRQRNRESKKKGKMHENAKYQIQITKWIFEGGNMGIDVRNIIPFVYENKKIGYVYFNENFWEVKGDNLSTFTDNTIK